MFVVAEHLHQPGRAASSSGDIVSDLRTLLEIGDIRFGTNPPAAVNKAIGRRFLGDGWALSLIHI